MVSDRNVSIMVTESTNRVKRMRQLARMRRSLNGVGMTDSISTSLDASKIYRTHPNGQLYSQTDILLRSTQDQVFITRDQAKQKRPENDMVKGE